LGITIQELDLYIAYKVSYFLVTLPHKTYKLTNSQFTALLKEATYDQRQKNGYCYRPMLALRTCQGYLHFKWPMLAQQWRQLVNNRGVPKRVTITSCSSQKTQLSHGPLGRTEREDWLKAVKESKQTKPAYDVIKHIKW